MDHERSVRRIYCIECVKMVLVAVEWSWIFLGDDLRHYCRNDPPGRISIASGYYVVSTNFRYFTSWLYGRQSLHQTRRRCRVNEVLHAGTSMGFLETGYHQSPSLLSRLCAQQKFQTRHVQCIRRCGVADLFGTFTNDTYYQRISLSSMGMHEHSYDVHHFKVFLVEQAR